MVAAKATGKASGSKQKKGSRRVGKKIPVQDLSMLKENILNEMNKDLGDDMAKKSTKVDTKKESGKRPFENVLLPEEQVAGVRAGRATWVMPVLFVLCLVGIWVWLVVASQGVSESKIALKNIGTAIETNDVSSFKRHVDLDAVAGSVASQMFTAPAVGDDLPAAVQEQLKAMQARFDSVVKPGLVADLRTEALSFVETGALTQNDNAGDAVPSILERLLVDLSGDATPEVRFGDIQEMDEDAVATVYFMRDDLNLEIPVNVLLAKQEGAWKVVGLPNLNEALSMVESAEADVAASAKDAAAAKLAAVLEVQKLTKVAVGKDAMLVALSLKNMSDKAVVGFTGDVTFTDAGGRLMKTINLQDSDTLAAGATMSKTWTVPVNTAISSERHVLVLPIEAIGAAFVAKAITFADGTILE